MLMDAWALSENTETANRNREALDRLFDSIPGDWRRALVKQERRLT